MDAQSRDGTHCSRDSVNRARVSRGTHANRAPPIVAGHTSAGARSDTLPRPCATPLCPKLVYGTARCPDHQQDEQREANRRDAARRGTSYQRGYGKRWRKLTKIVLARDPICMICHAAPSTDSDHIVPKLPGQDAADVTEEELQGTCHSCHSRKTAAERQAAAR